MLKMTLIYGDYLIVMFCSLIELLGDWWVYGDHNYGDRVRAADGIDYAFGTLVNAGVVSHCGSIRLPKSRSCISGALPNRKPRRAPYST